jgi:hypothetical protein
MRRQAISPSVSPWEAENSRLLQRLTLILVTVGVCWRVVRYFLQFPVWGDEAMLCLNFLDRDYVSLTRHLYNGQIAPILFLWGELTAIRTLGSSELALRLVPFLAGLGALVLFWRLAWLTLGPLARTLAVGILAVSIFPVSMGTLAKPYALDMLMALAFWVPAVEWLRRPEKLGPLILLCAIAPLALLASYPAPFIGGAISLALLPAVWRHPDWKTRALYAVYNLALLGTFLANYVLIGMQHLGTVTGTVTTAAGMQTYWSEGFPPSTLLPLLKWLLLTHTGQMSAYPLGASNGGSTLTVLLCLVGIWWFWQRRQRALLVVGAAPFALSLLAAALHSYPYGAACRLSQHLGPPIILAAAAGGAVLILHVATAARRRYTWAACGLLVMIGIGGTVRDVIRPYRGASDRWLQQRADELLAHAAPGNAVVVENEPLDVDAVLCWHLQRRGRQVLWGPQVDPTCFAAARDAWCLRFAVGAAPAGPLQGPAGARGGAWTLKECLPATWPATRNDPALHCDVYHWVRGGGEAAAVGMTTSAGSAPR